MPWNCAFRSTFRLIPDANHDGDALDAFLESDGRTQEEVLAILPYDRARAAAPGDLPDPKRYRDGRQLFRTIGLLYDEKEGDTRRLHLTALGRAVARWRPVINERNALVLGRHAAQTLAACQLRNPTRDGSSYGQEVVVFPFAFIWRAMLNLDCTISSEELNRAIFRTHNEDELGAAIERIRRYRETGDPDDLGEEVVQGSAKNDRILVWMAWASFGWTLIQDKRSSGLNGYAIAPRARNLIAAAASVKRRHREFASEREYVHFLAECAGLPEDLR